MSNTQDRFDKKPRNAGDSKGRRRTQPFAGTVPRDVGESPWDPSKPPGGKLPPTNDPPINLDQSPPSPAPPEPAEQPAAPPEPAEESP